MIERDASGCRGRGRQRESLAVRVQVEKAECTACLVTRVGPPARLFVAERVAIHLGPPTPPDNLNRTELETFVTDVFRAAANADALVVAFASTRTLELIVPLEKRCNVPVISARPHAFWAGVRLLGIKAGVEGFGTVLSMG